MRCEYGENAPPMHREKGIDIKDVAGESMTIEEIGADFLISIIKMDLCGWSTLIGAASYLRNEKSPFAELCHNPNNVNIRKIYDKMGLSDEQIEKLKRVVIDSCPNYFSKEVKEVVKDAR